MTAQSFALFDTNIGRCGIAWSARGIAGVQLPEASEAKTRARLTRRYPHAREAPPPMAELPPSSACSRSNAPARAMRRPFSTTTAHSVSPSNRKRAGAAEPAAARKPCRIFPWVARAVQAIHICGRARGPRHELDLQRRPAENSQLFRTSRYAGKSLDQMPGDRPARLLQGRRGEPIRHPWLQLPHAHGGDDAAQVDLRQRDVVRHCDPGGAARSAEVSRRIALRR